MNVFLVDIGGTWTRFRYGGQVERISTPSRLHHPLKSSDALIQELVYLVAERAPACVDAYVSLGAAYDPEVDIAYGSGPLWGAGRYEVPFRRLLEKRRPDVHWSVSNDITAGLAHFAKQYARSEDRYVMYITISSGIALRTAHLPTGQIDVNSEGLQGEVGHLPATSSAADAVRGLACECGGVGHIASISAGPAIPYVAERLGITRNSQEIYLDDGPSSRTCESLLRVIIEPIANLIRTVRVLQPHVDLIGIGGGVPSGIGTPYKRELNRQLSAVQSYSDGHFKEHPRLHVVSFDQVCPEIGAELMAQGYLRNIK
jgi:glucokinase